MFPGQGSQYVGMASDLYEYDEVKRLFDQTSQIINDDIAKIMFSGPDELLTESKNAQVAILLHSFSVFSLMKDRIKFDAVCGHSLGEYTALLVSGVFDFKSAVELVRKRGELMSYAGLKAKGSMAAVIGLSPLIIEDVLSKIEGVVIANYNGDQQTVISGTVEGIQNATEILSKKGARRVVKLNVSGAFHSPLMDYAYREFADFIDRYEFNKPKSYVLMNVSANFENDPTKIRELLKKQIISPVKWTQIMRNLIDNGYGNFYEMGPSKVLSGILKKIDLEKRSSSFEKKDEILNFKE